MTILEEAELSDLERQVGDFETRAAVWNADSRVLDVIRQKLNLEVAPHVAELVSLLDNVTDALELGADRIDRAKKAVQEAKVQCVSDLDEEETAVKGHLDYLTTALAAETHRLITIREEFSSGCAEVLEDFVTNDVEEVTAEIDETIESLSRTLTSKAEDVLRKTVEKAESDVRRQLEEIAAPAIEVVEESIDELFARARAALLDSSEEASSKREAMEAMLEQLEPAFDALEGALDHVRGVASSVGVELSQ